ncbi:brain-specific angiogenesis inhibitor 1-associated protein 2-like protein 2 [Cheilinus undulatus]|uniref:brain-specific angiogenesis inhibitor 1-associated protein 2-like protein 2 n=1 Tax=Cheilinus undulatus TaxID=241271 RepID=UPI001BD57BC1|nr:brain-specific angiogenesis inhibitor 1-associated protein 2-like protein 2 [Cheilinus undulatus]
MSEMNNGQLHRQTLGIYSNLMDDFNPSLERLVSLGNSYMQAFQALAVTSEAYFSALSKIGEKAFHSVSSRPLGDVLIQISENQRRLTKELEGVFRWFSVEVLQELGKNVRLDKEYVSNSRKRYEMEVHNQTTALERQPRRGANLDYGEHVYFLRESYSEALKEEERRHRFLAEKHCGLIQAISRLMNKLGGSFQQRADAWTDEVNATREPEPRQPASDYNSIKEIRPSREEQSLGRMPSRAPSPQGSIYLSKAESVGGGGGGGGGRSMRAKVDHQPGGSNPTVLPFTKGEMITVTVQQSRNGWLYGRAESSSRQGWFPASYVEEVDFFPRSPGPSLRSSGSMNNLLDHPGSSSQGKASQPPPPPPPPPSLSSHRQPETQPFKQTADKRAESHSENKRSKAQGPPELFPRGTNPFATVKLKPTVTNDRSAPRLYRR